MSRHKPGQSRGAPPKQSGKKADSASPAPPTATSAASPAPRDDEAVRGATLDPWSRYWLAPVAAVRPWLILKITLFVLAFDVLDTHLGPAWRYGAAGFNVPHFAWMEALPLPTTAAYVGVLFLVSMGALVAALMLRPPRFLLISIAALYTWGWSCSMHDSYQHHYLVSVILVALALFPSLDARALFGDARTPTEAPHGLVPRAHALGYTLLTSVCAVVYTFTAVSKTEPDWLSGDAMRSITHDGASIRGAMDLAESFGVTGEDFWWWLGHGVVPVQVICALTYALAPLRDGASTRAERAELGRLVAGLWARAGRGPAIAGGLVVGGFIGAVLGFALGLGGIGIASVTTAVALVGACLFFDGPTWRFVLAPLGRPRPLDVLATVGLLTAVSFHLGAEHLALAIGWFSSYMIAIALVALLPARWLSLAAFAISAPLRTRATATGPGLELPKLVLAGLAGAALLVVLGQMADLPGAVAATTVAALVLVAVVVLAARGLLPARAAMHAALACAVAGGALTGWLHVTDARFDYYRFAGGDFRRRLDYEAALGAYIRSNRYAPPGESRDDRIEEMRAQIAARRGIPVGED